jgi:hypothetical protein
VLSGRVDQATSIFGHYWLQFKPKGLAANIANVNYSVAIGAFCAYHWSSIDTHSDWIIIGLHAAGRHTSAVQGRRSGSIRCQTNQWRRATHNAAIE